MIRALYTAASGMQAQELNLDNIANNLANSSTAGFRSRRLQFEDLIYQNLIMPGAAASQRPLSWPDCRSDSARARPLPR
ncbi:MAG TPA: flagellar basal body protein [Candidatus Sulfotelmatobacter sp.]